MRFGSLFAGIGGMDLGLERSGMECAWQVEIDDYATRVLAKHWPDVPRFRDIRDVGSGELTPVDLICGGFPCQDISNAGNRSGIGGERSGLWGEYVRVIRELRPRIVLVENVAALLIRGMGRVLGDLASLGFDAEWECVPASAIGAPHRRDRVFIVANDASVDGNGRDKTQSVKSPRPDATRRLVFSELGPRRWDTEPGMGRVVERSAVGMDRLRGLGNIVVPQVAEFIGRRIMEVHG